MKDEEPEPNHQNPTTPNPSLGKEGNVLLRLLAKAPPG